MHAIKSLYNNVSCTVDVNQSLSHWFDVHSGVKQGCILSPMLFALYIDDLVEELNQVEQGVRFGDCMLSALLYADDIVLTAPDEGSLQKLIKVVEKWCRRWGMALNIKKTNIVHFRNKQTSRSEYNFIFDDKKIAYTSNYKYLGLLLNEHLDWQGAITEIINKSNKALAILNQKTRINGGLHFCTYTKLFNQLIVPIVITNACIWGHRECKEILRIQYKAMRFILGVGKSCPIAALFGETGWVPLSLTIKFSITRFRLRLNRMEHNRIPYKMYVWSDSLTGRGGRSKRVNWANKTQSILDSIDDPAGGMTADEVWRALATQALGQWKEDIQKINNNSESGGRLRFYKDFKTTPNAEKYVENGLSLNKRRVITQIRTGCLPLEIETGRYRTPKTPLEDRKCQLCEEDIGDEVHLLLGCTKLENVTQNLDRYLCNTIQLRLRIPV